MSRKPVAFRGHPVSFEAARAHEVHRSTCDHVVDGDTQDYLLDLGWLVYPYRAIRLRGINCPEVHRPINKFELEHGNRAKQFVIDLILGKHLLVRGHKGVSFERFEGQVFHPAPGGSLVVAGIAWKDLAETLRDNGFERLSDEAYLAMATQAGGK